MPGRIVTAHSIKSTVRFHCLDENLASKIEFLAAEPDVCNIPEAVVDIGTAGSCEDFYDFKTPYGGQPGTSGHLLSRAHRILHELMIAETDGCPVIHGASIIANSRRLLLMAETGVGKTSLSLKCLAAGLTVEGDEHVVVRNEDVVAIPRTLRVKHGSISVVPELAQQILCSPKIMDWNGDPIYSFAPRLPGQQWTIRPGRADALVFLTPNHGGLTSINFLTSNEAFGRLVKTVFLPENCRAAALGRLHMLVSGTKCVEMRFGCPETAMWHLCQLSLT